MALLTVRRAASGVAKPFGDLGDLFRALPQNFFVALGNEPAACWAGDGVSVSLEPCLVSVEFMAAMRADEMQRGGGLIGQRPYSWHWLPCRMLPQLLPRRDFRFCPGVDAFSNCLISLAPGVGLEPTTQRLTAACSTN
jgi:hypothetical protein